MTPGEELYERLEAARCAIEEHGIQAWELLAYIELISSITLAASADCELWLIDKDHQKTTVAEALSDYAEDELSDAVEVVRTLHDNRLSIAQRLDWLDKYNVAYDVTFQKLSPPKCQAAQYSDSMMCKPCNISWDMNDPARPSCQGG